MQIGKLNTVNWTSISLPLKTAIKWEQKYFLRLQIIKDKENGRDVSNEMLEAEEQMEEL